MNQYRVTFTETIRHEWTVAAECVDNIREMLEKDYVPWFISNVKIEEIKQEDDKTHEVPRRHEIIPRSLRACMFGGSDANAERGTEERQGNGVGVAAARWLV